MIFDLVETRLWHECLIADIDFLNERLVLSPPSVPLWLEMIIECFSGLTCDELSSRYITASSLLGPGGIFDIKNIWGWNYSLSSENFCRGYNMATTTPLNTHYNQLVFQSLNNQNICQFITFYTIGKSLNFQSMPCKSFQSNFNISIIIETCHLHYTDKVII